MRNGHSVRFENFKNVDIICRCCGNRASYSVPAKKYPQVFSLVKLFCNTCQILTEHYVLGDSEITIAKLRFNQNLRPWEREIMNLLEMGHQQTSSYSK